MHTLLHKHTLSQTCIITPSKYHKSLWGNDNPSFIFFRGGILLAINIYLKDVLPLQCNNLFQEENKISWVLSLEMHSAAFLDLEMSSYDQIL